MKLPALASKRLPFHLLLIPDIEPFKAEFKAVVMPILLREVNLYSYPVSPWARCSPSGNGRRVFRDGLF